MYTLNSSKMFFDMADNQAIVINHVTGMYYGFSYLGSYVVNQLINGSSIKEIINVLQKENGCPDNIENDINLFIEKLESLEIIVKSDSDSKTPEQPGPVAFSEGFNLTVDEYAEAADLILADPIHDVEEGQGWPIMKD